MHLRDNAVRFQHPFDQMCFCWVLSYEDLFQVEPLQGQSNAYLLLGTTAFVHESRLCFEQVATPLAPAHWEAELANVLRMAVKAGVVSAADGPARLALARRLGIESIATSTLSQGGAAARHRMPSSRSRRTLIDLPNARLQPRRPMKVPDADGCKRWLAGSPWSLAVFRLRRASVCNGGECARRSPSCRRSLRGRDEVEHGGAIVRKHVIDTSHGTSSA